MKKTDAVQRAAETVASGQAYSPVQTDAYNQSYEDWREREGNFFSFPSGSEQNAHTYIDGIGVQENGPVTRERKALLNVCLLIAGVVLIYELVENVLVLPLMLTFKALGVEVSYSFNDNIAYGNQYAVLCVLLFESLLKHLLPLWLVHRQVKMPLKTAIPLKIRDGMSTGAAMSALCVGFFLASFLRLFFPMEIFNVNNIGMTYEVISYMDGWCSTVYLLFELVISSVLAELLFHGELFQVLRQFGVSYAVLLTAFLNTTMLHDPVAFGTAFVTALVAGYGVWQSGSLLTGIGVHILSRVLSFLLFQSGDFPRLGIASGYVWFIFLVLIIGGGCWCAISLFRRKKRYLHDYPTNLSMKEKVKTAVFSGPMLAAWFLCFLLMMVEIFV
ncbi:MAG: CPBP family intramembrane metalloprotease [Ruminococcus sp.]|nr:CPBP family intramembrane metalloprotease [Ruminococcus sp.]